jgi:hypothetical protein
MRRLQWGDLDMQLKGSGGSGRLTAKRRRRHRVLVDGTIKAVDGPFTEANELIGGYAVLEVQSKAEAVELAMRLMQIHKDHWPGWEGSCEVRQLGDS